MTEVQLSLELIVTTIVLYVTFGVLIYIVLGFDKIMKSFCEFKILAYTKRILVGSLIICSTFTFLIKVFYLTLNCSAKYIIKIYELVESVLEIIT